MPAPTLKSFAAQMYDSMAPLAKQDASLGWPLAVYLAAIGEMFQVVDDYSRDQLVNGNIAPGWSQLMDVNRCPVEALPWLGQFVGVQVDTALTEAQQRAQIVQASGWDRGTVPNIVNAVAATLTGTKSVSIVERDSVACPSLPAYGLSIYTRTGETPSTSKTLAAILSQKPAGIVLNFQVLAGVTYQDLFSTYGTYGVIYSTFVTYQGVFTKTPGT